MTHDATVSMKVGRPWMWLFVTLTDLLGPSIVDLSDEQRYHGRIPAHRCSNPGTTSCEKSYRDRRNGRFLHLSNDLSWLVRLLGNILSQFSSTWTSSSLSQTHPTSSCPHRPMRTNRLARLNNNGGLETRRRWFGWWSCSVCEPSRISFNSPMIVMTITYVYKCYGSSKHSSVTAGISPPALRPVSAILFLILVTQSMIDRSETIAANVYYPQQSTSSLSMLFHHSAINSQVPH